MKPAFTIAAVCILVGGAFAAGWFARETSPSEPPRAASGEGTRRDDRSRRADRDRTGPRSEDDSSLVVETRTNHYSGAASTVSIEDELVGSLQRGINAGSSTSQIRDLVRWAHGVPIAQVQQALEYSNAIPSRTSRLLAQKALVRRWAEVDPAAAIAHVEALKPGAFQDGLFASAVEGLALEDPKAAVEVLMQLPGSAFRQAVDPVLREVAAEDPTYALTLVDRLGDDDRGKFQVEYAIFSEWASRDPQKALATARQMQSESGLRAALKTFTNDNPEDAMDYASSLRDGDLIRDALSYWTYDDPLAAVEYALANDQQLAGQGIQTVMQHWAERDVDEVLEWLTVQGSGPLRDQGYMEVSNSLLRRDPEEAARVVGMIEEPQLRAVAVQSVARTWSNQDPGEAARWVESFPETPDKGRALGEVVRQWTARDPAQTAQWLESLPPSYSRDVAVKYYSWQLERRDPARAVQWASAIRDPELRLRQQVNASRVWLSRDRQAATQWLQNSNLPSEAITRLTQPQ